MKKEKIRNLLAFVLLLWCTLQARAAVSFRGSGTATDPYLIESLADLQSLSESVYEGASYSGKFFKQTVDIVVNQKLFKSDGTFDEENKKSFIPWKKPLGSEYRRKKKPFKGNYDGGNHSIKGLYFAKDLIEAQVGLFGLVKNAMIQNITIEDSYMETEANGHFFWDDNNNHGFLAGLAQNCSFINCHVKNSVMNAYANGLLYAGGLIGHICATSMSMTLKNCSFSGTINFLSHSYGVYVSGFVGKNESNYSVNMEDCSLDGSLNLVIDSKKHVEQCYIAGFLYNVSGIYTVNMSNCINRMDFNVSSKNFTDPAYCDGEGNLGYNTPANYLNKFSGVRYFSLYSMCNHVSTVTNCANFGNVTLGYSNTLGPVESMVIEPFYCIDKSLKDCAFYGYTRLQHKNYFISRSGDNDEKTVWIFKPNIRNIAKDIDSKVTISRVLRREAVFYDNDGNELNYVVDKGKEPNGVKSYYTNEWQDIVNDAGNIVNEFTGYDDTDGKAYAWGYLQEGNFKGCAIPVTLGGGKSNLVGEGTATNPYIIQDEVDYVGAVTSINATDSSDKYYKLNADLDLSNSGTISAIGTTAYPFQGHFDGNGHCIKGLKTQSGSMFDMVGNKGSIQYLTLLDMTCDGVNACYPLVTTLAGGKISNCYVGGTIDVTLNPLGSGESVRRVAGLCGSSNAGTIEHSYFKGNFNLKGRGNQIPVVVSGLCDNPAMASAINDSYSIFKVNATDGCTLSGAYGIVCANSTLTDVALTTDKKVFFMTDVDGVHTENGKQASSYSDLKMSSAFLNGVYNPVLKYAKHYELTSGKGLDAVVMDGEGTGDMANCILHYKPAGADYKNDQSLWQHPNLAIYDADAGAEYLINCTLDATQDLKLNMDEAASQTIKANMHYPLSIYNPNDGVLLQMLCLPVTVDCNALPEGSKLKIVGKKTFDKANSQYISTMVECDSVPAGVPFLLEIAKDKTSTDKAATFDLVLRGTVAAEPVSTINEGKIKMDTEFRGTYQANAKPDACLDICQMMGANYSVTSSESQTVSPFHAYAEVDGTYILVDNLLLDELSDNVSSMLQTYNGKTKGVILKRSMNADVWNTVCLPFALSASEIAEAFGEGTKVEKLSRIENDATDGTTIVFAKATDMEVGKTYLVKPAQNGTLYNFPGKEIKNELASEPEDATSQAFFKGTFAPTLLEGTTTTDGYNYFFQGNKLYYLPENQGVAMKGFRGWILIASGIFGSEPAKLARLKHFDGSTTDVRAIEYGKTADDRSIYNLQGVELPAMQKGVNIIDGKKVMK